MPFIRVNCPKAALAAAQKAKLAPLLVEALIQQEIDPVTDSKLIGATQGPGRLAKVKEIAARMKASRLS